MIISTALALFHSALISLPAIAEPPRIAAAGAPAPCRDGKNRRVKMINDTRVAIHHLYGSNVGADDWQEDVLGEDVLGPGQTVTVNWDDGSCYCNFDFKAVFADGDTAIKRSINVCDVGNFRFYD